MFVGMFSERLLMFFDDVVWMLMVVDVFLKTKKMRDVCTIILAAVSRRDLCYVSENEGFRFWNQGVFVQLKCCFGGTGYRSRGNRRPLTGEPAARPTPTDSFRESKNPKGKPGWGNMSSRHLWDDDICTISATHGEIKQMLTQAQSLQTGVLRREFLEGDYLL